MLQDLTGADLASQKKNMVYNRLLPRIKALKLPSFEAYAKEVSQNEAEAQQFVNLLVNSLTAFFRENHHFKFLAHYLEELFAKQSIVNIWSCGCSSGEEAYSIALVLWEVLKQYPHARAYLLASDINTDSLQTAASGIYESEKISLIDPLYLSHFYRGKNENKGYVKVKEYIRQLIQFSQINLISDWHIDQVFDVIFCRNVTIYFSEQHTRLVLARLDKLLSPNGILILGASENIQQLRHRYERIDTTVYRKLNGAGS
jgi:chemotaxis protein methyltransferase CheR